MKLRKFSVDKNGLVLDDYGEWYHINDIRLRLIEARDSIKSYLEYISNKKDDWHEKEKYAEEKKIEFLNSLLNEFK